MKTGMEEGGRDFYKIYKTSEGWHHE